MSNSGSTTRIILSEEASLSLSKMLQSVKQDAPHLSINHSALASFLVTKFIERDYFKRNLKEIEQEFFNEKKFLRKVLAEGGDLGAAIKQVEIQRKVRRTKT